MTVIGMTKKTHVDTSQMGNPSWLLSSIPQNADSGISTLSAKASDDSPKPNGMKHQVNGKFKKRHFIKTQVIIIMVLDMGIRPSGDTTSTHLNYPPSVCLPGQSLVMAKD